MFGRKIKICTETMARIKDAVGKAGYSSVDEFIENAIEKELERVNTDTGQISEEEEKVRSRLQGLGYLK